MTKFLTGEYEAKLDAKSRVVLPAGYLKQLAEVATEGFVLNRGFDKCLVLYPKASWDSVLSDLNNLDQYIAENRRFVRLVTGGATPIELDAANRFIIPKRLAESVFIEKDVIFFGNMGKIEIWDKATFENETQIDTEDLSALAQKVMGGKQNG